MAEMTSLAESAVGTRSVTGESATGTSARVASIPGAPVPNESCATTSVPGASAGAASVASGSVWPQAARGSPPAEATARTHAIRKRRTLTSRPLHLNYYGFCFTFSHSPCKRKLRRSPTRTATSCRRVMNALRLPRSSPAAASALRCETHAPLTGNPRMVQARSPRRAWEDGGFARGRASLRGEKARACSTTFEVWGRRSVRGRRSRGRSRCRRSRNRGRRGRCRGSGDARRVRSPPRPSR